MTKAIVGLCLIALTNCGPDYKRQSQRLPYYLCYEEEVGDVYKSLISINCVKCTKTQTSQEWEPIECSN